MKFVRPAIHGHEHRELVWAKNWPGVARIAVPVNADELVDTLVMRVRF